MSRSREVCLYLIAPIRSDTEEEARWTRSTNARTLYKIYNLSSLISLRLTGCQGGSQARAGKEPPVLPVEPARGTGGGEKDWELGLDLPLHYCNSCLQSGKQNPSNWIIVLLTSQTNRHRTHDKFKDRMENKPRDWSNQSLSFPPPPPLCLQSTKKVSQK